MDVFFQELKRQLNLKRLLTYIVISVTLAGLWTWFIVGGATEGFMQSGCYKGYKGKEAIEVAAKDRNVTAGKMTENKFEKGRDIFLNALRSDDESDVKITKELLQYAVYADELINQNIKLKKIMGESIEGYVHLPKDAGRNYYENEDLYYRKYIEENAHNKKEKTLALSMWNSVKKPYTYYSGFKQWGEGTGHIIIFSFVLMVMIGIFSSSIIAKDKETGMDEIITTTMKGKKYLTVAKIFIPIIMSGIIYLCGVGIYIILLKYLLPAEALKTSMQILGKSLFSYNAGDLLRKVFIFGAVGVLTVAAFSTFISSIVKKSSRAIQISILTILIAFILGVFVNMNAPIFNMIKVILPGGAIFSYLEFIELRSFPFITLFGKVFLMPSILVIISICIFLLSTVFTMLNYKRR